MQNGATKITIDKSATNFTVDATHQNPHYNMLVLLAAYDQLAKKYVAEHQCHDPLCVATEMHEEFIHAINQIRYRYEVTRRKGMHDEVNLKRVFMLALNHHKQPELISLFDMLRAERFDDVDRWFEINVKQCLGIKPGDFAKTIHFQNMVLFLRRNGARIVDLEAFGNSFEEVHGDHDQQEEIGAKKNS